MRWRTTCYAMLCVLERFGERVGERYAFGLRKISHNYEFLLCVLEQQIRSQTTKIVVLKQQFCSQNSKSKQRKQKFTA